MRRRSNAGIVFEYFGLAASVTLSARRLAKYCLCLPVRSGVQCRPMKSLKTIVLALTLGAGGCSVMDYKPLGSSEVIKNAQGHVIGYRERMCDCDRGEELDRVVLFKPRLGERGKIVAYEERVKGGAILRDVNGKRIGNRFADLRSRGQNRGNGGLTIVFIPPETDRLAQLHIAQVTIEDIKHYLQITN
jgi:hypothetical protein